MVLAGGLACLGLAGAALTGTASDWPQLQRDAARLGRSADEVAPPYRARWLWFLLPSSCPLLLRLLVGRVALEDARLRKLAELVADHLVRHVDRNVLLAVVHGDRQADEVGQDRGATRPGLDRLLVLDRHRLIHLRDQVMIVSRRKK